MRVIDTDTTNFHRVNRAQDVSVDEAAELLDVKPEYIQQLIDEGTLSTVAGQDRERGVLIPIESVLELRTSVESTRRRHLTELIRLSEEYGLYEIDYGPDFSPEDESEPLSD